MLADSDLDVAVAMESFREIGLARLGRVMSKAALERLRQRADDIMLGRVSYPGLFFQRDSDSGRYEDLPYGRGYEGPRLDYRKIEKLEKDDLFRAWLENELFRRVVQEVVPGSVAIYRAVLFTKGQDGGSPIPWHQDGGSYWGLDRDPAIQLWTALDDASSSQGCLEIVPGSHRGGLATPLGGVIPHAIVETGLAQARREQIEVQAGEVLLIHPYLWHRSGRTTGGSRRRAFTVCYIDAATRCLRKKREPRKFVRVFEESRPTPNPYPIGA